MVRRAPESSSRILKTDYLGSFLKYNFRRVMGFHKTNLKRDKIGPKS